MGDLVTYTLAVANAGPVNAENTVLSDPLPDALASPEVSLDGGRSFQPWAGTLALGTLLPGQAQTILLRGTVRASADALLINTATVQSDTPDPNPDNNTDTEELPVQLAADLAITKLGSPSPVSAGGLLTYTLDLTNLGPAYAQNVSLTDPLPPPLSDGAYSLDNGGTWQPWTGSLALGTLPAGDHRQILLRGTVAQGTSGTLTNTATVASDTPDPRPENNESTALTPVDTAADLALTKSGAPNPVLHGQALVYTLSLTNLGPDPAVHPVLTDPLSPLLLEPAFSTNGGATWQPWAGTWQPGSLAPGQRVELLLRGTVSLEAEGILVNTAVVTSDTPDPNPDNNQATERTPIDTAADLAVLKQVQPARVHPGETLTYTLQVTNAGPSAAQDVVLQDPLPAAILSPVFSADGGATWQPWSSTYVLRTLLPGTTATLLLQGQVDPSTTASSLENTALVTSSTPDPNPDNNEDTVEVPLLPSADLSVRKENTGGSAVPGTPFLYTITLQNAGPSDAQDVLLTDAVPAELWAPEFSHGQRRHLDPVAQPLSAGHPGRRCLPLPPAAGDHRPRRYPSPSQYRCGGQFHPGPGSHQQHRPAGGPPSARCGPGHHQGGRYRHCCPWRPADLYAHHRQPGPCHRPGCSSHRPDSRQSVPRGSFPGQRAHLDPVDRGLFPGSASSRSGKNPCCCAAACLPLPRAPL